MTNMYPSPAEPGHGTFVHEQVEDLRAVGVEVDCLAFDGRRARRAYVAAGRRLRARVGTGRFELVHAHYGLTGAVAVSQRRVPVVTTFHGSDLEIPWQRAVSRFAANRSKAIVISARSAQHLGRSRSTVLPIGVDCEFFAPLDRAAVRARLGWGEEPVVVFPSSPLRAEKNFALFEAVVAELRETWPRLRTVCIDGFAREQVRDVLGAADVVVVTSHYEGGPLTSKEALACMTPVVGVPVGDLDEQLRGLPGCIVVPPDRHALAAAVRRSLASGRDPALRERAMTYSRPALAVRLLEIYEGVLAAGVQAGPSILRRRGGQLGATSQL